MTSIRRFCDKHGACPAGRTWVLANCKDMADAWDKIRPDWLIWVVTRPGVLDYKTLCLLACRFARETPLGDGRMVWDLLTDLRSRTAVETSERFARGEATREEFEEARAAAWAAVLDVDKDWPTAVMPDADWFAARAAADAADTARVDDAAVIDSSLDTVLAADDTISAVWSETRHTEAVAAAREAQARMIRELPNPFLR